MRLAFDEIGILKENRDVIKVGGISQHLTRLQRVLLHNAVSLLQRQLGIQSVEVFSTLSHDEVAKLGGDAARVSQATPGE